MPSALVVYLFFFNHSSLTGFYKTPQAECYLVGQLIKVAYENILCAYLKVELGVSLSRHFWFSPCYNILQTGTLYIVRGLGSDKFYNIKQFYCPVASTISVGFGHYTSTTICFLAVYLLFQCRYFFLSTLKSFEIFLRWFLSSCWINSFLFIRRRAVYHNSLPLYNI